MRKFSAILMHGNRAAQGEYEFEGDDRLFDDTPVKIMRAFMDSIEERLGVGFIEYEINGALKNTAALVVTVIGEFHFEDENSQPFMCMIRPS